MNEVTRRVRASSRETDKPMIDHEVVSNRRGERFAELEHKRATSKRREGILEEQLMEWQR